jgi:CPA1 family monovalent cation:H+ antiporter
VIGTLLLHGLTLPLLIRRLGGRDAQERADALAAAAAQDKAATAAAQRLDELLADGSTDVDDRAADVLRAWNSRRRTSAWERVDDHGTESPMAVFRDLRLQMLAAERGAFIAERDNGNIDDHQHPTVLPPVQPPVGRSGFFRSK